MSFIRDLYNNITNKILSVKDKDNAQDRVTKQVANDLKRYTDNTYTDKTYDDKTYDDKTYDDRVHKQNNFKERKVKVKDKICNYPLCNFRQKNHSYCKKHFKTLYGSYDFSTPINIKEPENASFWKLNTVDIRINGTVETIGYHQTTGLFIEEIYDNGYYYVLRGILGDGVMLPVYDMPNDIKEWCKSCNIKV